MSAQSRQVPGDSSAVDAQSRFLKKGRCSPYLGDMKAGQWDAKLAKLPDSTGSISGKRAPKVLEAKWKITALRSPLCEGCGQASFASPAGAGSKYWKCGPCVRALEESYLRELENLERQHQTKHELSLATSVQNKQLREEWHKRGFEVEKLSLLLHEAESKLNASNSFLQQLMGQIAENKTQFHRMVGLQNEVMTENGRLHGNAQTAGTELERTAHIVRDLENANQVMRDENQKLSQRVQSLLDTIASLREELRGSFKSQEALQISISTERKEWQESLRILEAENEEMRRRLRWLEEDHQRDRERSSFLAGR